MSNGLEEAKQAITEVCEALKTSPAIGRAIDDLRVFLIAKNRKYDNSVFNPIQVFSRASVETLTRARLNDKVTRILRGELAGEDAFDDLMGYLVLLRAIPIYMNLICGKVIEQLGQPSDLPIPTQDDERNMGAWLRDVGSPVPGPIVTASLANRGLRVGMTFEEVRANKWTECEAKQDGPIECTEGDPCSACKFLDGAICECGHPYTVHHPAMASVASDCHACPRGVECLDFSLASWPSETLDDVAAEVAANVDGWTAALAPDPSEGIRTQSNEQNALLATEAAQPKKDPTMTDTKKPRINRATWHESADGKHAIGSVLGFLSEEPIVSWAIGELTKRSGLDRTDVDLALEHLLASGAIVQHGKAKGTRYAVAGFTDWPAPLPRGKRNDSAVSTADADAAHSLDASDSEET